MFEWYGLMPEIIHSFIHCLLAKTISAKLLHTRASNRRLHQPKATVSHMQAVLVQQFRDGLKSHLFADTYF